MRPPRDTQAQTLPKRGCLFSGFKDLWDFGSRVIRILGFRVQGFRIQGLGVVVWVQGLRF